jgi:peroxiredoxin
MALATAAGLALPAFGDGPPAGPVLHLADGGFVAGEPAGSPRAGVLRWRGRAFDGPFDFSLDGVRSIEWPPLPTPPGPVGDHRFDLAGRDVLFGRLIALDGDSVTLECPRLGRIHVARSVVRRISRRRGASGPVYLGPNGLAGWTTAKDAPGWRDEAGHLVAEGVGSALTGVIGLPAKAVVEFQLSWKTRPDFLLAIGVDEGEESLRDAARFEVFGDDVTAVLEADRRADLAPVEKVHDGPGRLHLRAYFDQEAGRLQVYTADGVPKAELSVPGRRSRARAGVHLADLRGGLRLECLEVGRWGDGPPHEVPGSGPGVVLADGTTLAGLVEGYDAGAGSFTLRIDGGERRVPADQADVIVLPSPADPVRGPSARLVYQDGSRIGGDPTSFGADALELNVPGIEGPLRAPLAGLRSLAMAPREGGPPPNVTPTPRLESDGVRLRGRLAAAEGPDAGPIAWKPAGSDSSASLRPGVDGRIVFKERAPPPELSPRAASQTLAVQRAQALLDAQVDAQQKVLAARQAAAARLGAIAKVEAENRPAIPAQPAPVADAKKAGVAQPAPAPVPADVAVRAVERMVVVQPAPAVAQKVVVVNGVRTVVPASPPPPVSPMLHLRAGDTIPAVITKIDEEGVWIESPLSEAKFVPHGEIKAAVLASDAANAMRMTKAKRERLLTLPRMQKGAPPTQLIRSTNGDYLRGRIVAMDDRTLQFEVRLETKSVPREVVSRIIWLHADELGPEEAAGPPADDGGKTRVQALRADGVRLGFVAERSADDTLAGTSPALGACRVRLDEVDQVLIGRAIDREAAHLAFHQWKLQDAPEPKFAQDGPGGATGTESPLVGRPAPDLKLDGLDGRPFRLADYKGQVVVLDFWATWCGPCLQAMPQVERVAGEFKDRGVHLVAVNLQESTAQIKATLERRKLDVAVALDRDGSAARKYEANAIPQTVVIDRQGNVARLFVGGGPHLGDQLREAIEAVLGRGSQLVPED